MLALIWPDHGATEAGVGVDVDVPAFLTGLVSLVTAIAGDPMVRPFDAT